MRSLKEVYGLTNQKILKEEIDFSSNKATVYHLCGNKVGVPDPFANHPGVDRSIGGSRQATGD